MTCAKSRDGLVHALSAINSEFTLCGDAFDIDSEKGYEDKAWVEVTTGIVNCPRCVKQIVECRKYKVDINAYER